LLIDQRITVLTFPESDKLVRAVPVPVAVGEDLPVPLGLEGFLPIPTLKTMLDATTFAVFLVAALTLIITPGPNMMYVSARSIGQGKNAGAISALGVGVGNLVHTLAAALGLSTLLMSSVLAYGIIKYLGAAYLIYLGIRTLVQKEKLKLPETQRPNSLMNIFSQGVVTAVLNPKAALFFLAFLPQFADPSRGIAWQIAILGIIYSVMTAASYSLVAFLARAMSRSLEARSSFSRLQRWFTGSVLIGLGVRIALPEKA